MKRFILTFWPIIFIFSLWFIFSYPYFVQRKVPYPSTYQVNFFPPWSSYPKFWGPVKNGAMPDVIDQIYPWKHFTIETLKDGQIPLWNPYSFSGNPHLANFQTAVLSPFNLLFFLPAGRQGALPFVDAWSMLVLLQPLLAGLFMYLLMREFKLSKEGSLIGSIAFMFCGFIVVWMAYGTLGFAILYLPLSLFAIEKYYSTKHFKFLILLSLTIPLSFFSGHFQISLYFLASLVSYVIFKGVTRRNLFAICYLLFAIIFGLFLSLPQLLPSIKLYLNSPRSELFLNVETIPLSYLITIISPDFFGNPVTRNDWFGHYAEWAGFIGIWPFLLALFALWQRKDKRIFYFALIGITSLILAVKSPISSLMVSLKMPVISTSALSRIIVLFSFSFAVLSGFGFDRLRESLEHKENVKKIILFLALVLFIFIIIWLLLLTVGIIPLQWLIVAKRNFVLPTFLFIFGAILILLSLKYKKIVLLTTCYVLLATSFDSLRFVQKWMPSDPKKLVFADIPVIAGIEKNIGYGRIFGNLGAHVDTYYGFPSVEGYDPLYIRRYGEFITSANNGVFEKAGRSVVKLDRRGKYTDRVLDLLGVSLIFHPIGDTNQGWAYPVWEDKERFSLVFKDEKFQLFKNKTALDRVTLFYDYEVIQEDKEIIKRFYSEDFDFRKTLILEEDPGLAINKNENANGKAEIISYTPNKVVIRVSTETSALLFLSDNFYPGWVANVDPPAGGETKIYRADYAFRSIVVPKGDSMVEFTYSKI